MGAPTPCEPVDIECTECEGKGCQHCDDTGHFQITSCPQRSHLDDDTLRLAELADLFFQGLPPVAGGVFDQDSWFATAAPYLRRQQIRLGLLKQ